MRRWRIEDEGRRVVEEIEATYLSQVPAFAPFARWAQWPTLGSWLPDGRLYYSEKEVRAFRDWLAAVAAQFDQAMQWLRAWRTAGGDVVKMLGEMIGPIGRSVPDGLPPSRARPAVHSAAATRGS
jgi:hypothetical protein